MKVLKRIARIALLFIIIDAAAATWESIPDAYVVDTSSIQREGDKFVIWQKMEMGGPTARFRDGVFVDNVNLPKVQLTMLTRYDCKKRTFQYLHMMTYEDSVLMRDDNTPDEVRVITPDSPYEKMLATFCKKKWEIWK